jgi:transcriptional regulator with XRE-family HTH domain
MDLLELGEAIRMRRTKSSLTQAQLASMINVSPQAVSNWERGENAPDIGLLPSIAAVLGCSIDDLLGYTYHSFHTYEGVALYADIRDFTDESVKLTPEEIATLLNSFFYSITEAVLRFNARPVKYIGDAFICVFLGDSPVDRSIKASVSAMKMAPGRFSIGLSYGEMYFGPIGHPDYAQHDVIGDYVNLAARACFWAAKSAQSHLAAPTATLERATMQLDIGTTETVTAAGKAVSVAEIVSIQE